MHTRWRTKIEPNVAEKKLKWENIRICWSFLSRICIAMKSKFERKKYSNLHMSRFCSSSLKMTKFFVLEAKIGGKGKIKGKKKIVLKILTSVRRRTYLLLIHSKAFKFHFNNTQPTKAFFPFHHPFNWNMNSIILFVQLDSVNQIGWLICVYFFTCVNCVECWLIIGNIDGGIISSQYIY